MVEGSSNVPSRVSQDQDWHTRYSAAMETAKKTGRTEDWQAVFRLKRETPAS
jgi:cellulase/cellobiase CelA1